MAYDGLLQLSKYGKAPFVKCMVKDSDWYQALCDDGGYFDNVGAVYALVLAGMTGLVTQLLILKVVEFTCPQKNSTITDYVSFMFATVLLSGLVGIPMHASGMFPQLSEHYYEKLGQKRAFVTDAWSGFIVNATVIFVFVILAAFEPKRTIYAVSVY